MKPAWAVLILFTAILLIPLLAGYTIALAKAFSVWTPVVAALGGLCTHTLVLCTRYIDDPKNR